MEKTEMTLQETPKVSLIVPMYMCESYVPELMAMLCGQDMREIEIICVIDGSPDRTRELVEKYAETDSRIRVIVQDHGGAGKARNTGMTAARGKYLMFPDADDDFQRNYVSTMYHSTEKYNADIVICQMTRMDFATQITYEKLGYDLLAVPVGKSFHPENLPNIYNAISRYPFNKIFKKELIEKYQISFSEIQSNNDVYFVCAALTCASCIAAIPDSLYTYKMNKNPSSITSNKKNTDFLTAFNDLFLWLNRWDLWNRNADNFIKGWQDSFHYQAKFGHNENFVQKVSGQIISNEPWKTMDDRTLYRRLRLDLSIQKTKADLIRFRKYLKRCLNHSTDICDFLLTRQMNEIQNVNAIKKGLEIVYGKCLESRDNLFRSIIWTIQDDVPSSFINTIFRRMKALVKIK